MVILVLSQVIKMRHFKYIISVFLINIIYSQDCIKGDCRDGYGEKKWDKASYKGYFENGRMSGEGEYNWTIGGSYKGTFREGFFDGKGIRTYNNGTVYEGEFKHDVIHGFGEIRYFSGGSYSGNWKFGKHNGYGVYKDAKGYSYQGEFNFNKKHGIGIQKWLSGDMYEGDFKNDYREGFGVYTWKSSGASYAGGWKTGKRQGLGVYKKDGTVKEGLWYENNYISNKTGCLESNQECLDDRVCCKIQYENSEILFNDDNKIIVSSKNKNTFLRIYPNATKRHYYDKNWKLTNYDNSKYYRIYSSLDSLKMTYSIKSYYTSNNQLQWIGNVRNNDLSATNCKDALCEGKTSWYNEDGSLSSQSEYLEGRSHGKTTIYYDSGKKLEMNYDRGVYVKK